MTSAKEGLRYAQLVQRADPSFVELGDIPVLARAAPLIGEKEHIPLHGEAALRHAILLAFSTSPPRQCESLRGLSARQWRRLLLWMDYSGLALYFLDRIEHLQICDWLPPEALDGLRQRQADNTERTRTLIAESLAIQGAFQDAGIRYAVLKGLSYWPICTPRPDLRSQFDLDFLIAKEDADEARTILERSGYRLYAATGADWEFRRNERPGLSIKDIYKPMPSFLVELHAQDELPGHRRWLDHTVRREMFGMSMPVLSPADQLIHQGLHAFKHVCMDFFRSSHLLEFRRHVLARAEDREFWLEVKEISKESADANIGLGVVVSLIAQMTGEFAPPELTHWTADCLRDEVKVWIELYGCRSALAMFPGTRLHLLLRRELSAAGTAPKLRIRGNLIPRSIPLTVVRAFPHETLRVRISRYRVHLDLILSRIYLYIVEGARCVWELRRFRRELAMRTRGTF